MDQHHDIDQATAALEITLKERKSRWMQLSSHLAQMPNLSFHVFLEEKGIEW
jgi:hypothetical protein